MSWKPDVWSEDVKQLYELVIPAEDRVDEASLLRRFSVDYSYDLRTARSGSGRLVAMALMFEDHHIDTFAVHPDYRALGLGMRLFKSLGGHTIEAYEKNASFFSDCNFHRVNIKGGSYAPKWVASPVILMAGYSISDAAAMESIGRWQEFQTKWGNVGYLY